MDNQQQEKILGLLEELKESNTLIIVEGFKDRKALHHFGITNIIQLNKHPLYKIIEDISNGPGECVILTDLDKKGKELYGKLNSGLQQFGVSVNNTFRNFLFRHTKLRQIEGLITYIHNLY